MTVSFKPVFINCKIKFKGTEFCSGISFVLNNLSNSSVRKLIMHAWLLLFSRLNHCIPYVAFFIDCIEEHEFSFTAGSFFDSVNTGTANTAVIKNHEGAGFNQIRKVVHHVMLNLAGHSI